ncbi:uncharacterized protein LOC142333940 [Lycorma delicatula]|uniref:uncharacterized protein LOC142333940 n=1 Tax=Lycorma delicatula TaxID=130591 RepID=UPI003F51ABF8
MREVLDIFKGGENVKHSTGSLLPTEKMSADKSKTTPSVNVLSTQPGYLDLTPEQAKRLIRTEPIHDYYEVEDEPFARGKYATVRRCRHRVTGRQFAAKFLRKRRRSADLRDEIIHEIAVLEACKHSSRIVKLHEVFETTQDMILLLELACGGELQMLLDKDEVPTERQVVRLMKQILDGLIDLHKINVAHLDIKPQNLVLTGEFPDCDVKLCDFGISRYLNQGVDVREILGTPDYVAPEVLNYEPISLATDMWSVGVLLYVLLTGCSPFGGDSKQETFCNIAQCRLDFPDDLFEDISEEAKDLMKKLMLKNPSKRLTAQECLQHRWLTMPSTAYDKTLMNNSLNSTTSNTLTNIATTPRTPTPSKKPAPTLEHSEEEDRSLSFDETINDGCTSKMKPSSSSPMLKTVTSAIKLSPNNNNSNNNISKQLQNNDLCINNNNVNIKNINNNNNNNSKGLSEERRKSFQKHMKHLVQRLEGENDDNESTELNNNNDNSNNKNNEKTINISSKLRSKDCGNATNILDNSSIINNNKISSPKNTNVTSTPLRRIESFSRNITRANGMQTMPVSRIRTYKIDRSCNIFTSDNKQNNLIFHHRDSSGDDNDDTGIHHHRSTESSIFKFRRVFILDDADDSPPPSINGSLSSENSSMSDSNSDTISEMSIDSSSDRSSVISLDDSFDFVYGTKTLTHNRHYTSCYNVWEAVKNQNASSSSTSNRTVWPRECSGSVARALSKFTTSTSKTTTTTTSSTKVTEYKEGNFHHNRQRKSLTIFNGTGNNTTLTTTIQSPSATKSPASKSTTNKKCVGLELMRDDNNGNVVVIREVKAVHGSKFPRCSEVKCESVQSRIRRLQIQNGLQTELAKQRYDVF